VALLSIFNIVLLMISFNSLEKIALKASIYSNRCIQAKFEEAQEEITYLGYSLVLKLWGQSQGRA
jgi:hypothetical protein